MKTILKNRKIVNLILAVLIAIVLWLYVVNVENPTGTVHLFGVPVEIQGEDVLEENGLMVTGISEDSVGLKVGGKKKTLMKLTGKNVSLSVDVSTIKGGGEWPLTGKVVLPANVAADTVTISDWDSVKVTVSIEPQVRRKIPIRAEFIGTQAAGCQIGIVETDPAVLEITGPESMVESISYALAQVGGESISETLTQEVSVILMGQDGSPVENHLISSSVTTVQATVPVQKVVTVPLTVTLQDGGGATAADVSVTVIPASVTLREEENTKLLEEISLGSIDLSQVFGQKSVAFPIRLPEWVTGWGVPTQATVVVTVDKLAMKAIEISKISLKNIPQGYSAATVNPTMMVWVRGTQSVLDDIATDQISAEVDLTNVEMSVGVHRLPVTVILSGDTTAGIVGNQYSIAVKLDQ